MRRLAWLAILLVIAGCGAPAAPGRGAATPPAAKAAAATTTAPTATAAAPTAPASTSATATTASTAIAAAPTASVIATAPAQHPTSATATSTATAPAQHPASATATSTVTAPAPRPASATATATATAPATAQAAGSQPLPPPLTPGAWAAAGASSACGSVLTADLVAYGEAAGAITPGTGGMLAVYLHNNTGLCNAAGRVLTLPGAGWRLEVTVLGATAVAAAADLPAPPATLAPGALVRLPVRVGAGLAPGWYTAAMQVSGAGAPPAASIPALQSIERFLVTAGPRPAGRLTADAYPAPVVGGLAMPLVSVAWDGSDLATVTVHAALACGPGTDRYASFGGVTATAAGRGFTTDLPDLGGGQDPAIAQASWDVAFPGEATSITVSARVQVRACGSGALLGSNGVAWRVDLPG